MYLGKKISVAMATYNGEKYLKEQLDSILKQTVIPDEIIISDDGSTDRTLEIASEYAEENKELINIVVMTDNPRHGIGGNFSWAIGHATGDYIFICGQDDVWLPKKVQIVTDVFTTHTDAEMVCHNLICIDSAGDRLEKHKVNSVFLKQDFQEGEVLRVERDKYFDAAISSVLISGPAACISQSMIEKCLPIPSMLPEDWWLQFCATADDHAYYIHSVLTEYRIHNSACHSIGLPLKERILKIIHRIKSANTGTVMMLRFADCAGRYLSSNIDSGRISNSAIRTLDRVGEVGRKVLEAESSSRIKGAYLLTKLYLNDIRYRRIGVKSYLTQLGYILIYNKSRRNKELEIR